MLYDVILTKHKNIYTARVKEWPEVKVKANSRERAIQQVKARLREYLTRQIEVIQVDIPLPESNPNPWLETFGRFKDDPTFEDMQADITAYRKEIDAEHAQGTAS
jgi:predicted RNase H-like HicB family nuclease